MMDIFNIVLISLLVGTMVFVLIDLAICSIQNKREEKINERIEKFNNMMAITDLKSGK